MSRENIEIPAGFKQQTIRTLDNGFPIKSWITEKSHKNEVYGVFNGGGAKGAAFSGAIEAFDEKYDWRRKDVAGTSCSPAF